MRGVAAPAKAPDKEAARPRRGVDVAIPGVISRQLYTGGASCVGVPMGIGCPKRPDGSKVDIVCADSRSALSVFVERASPGTKGYLSMFRNAGLLSSWVDFAPTSGGESGAADTYAQVYAGYATHRNKGHWEDIRFRRDRTCSEPRMPTQVGNPLIPPLAAIHTQSVRANNHRGSINSTSLTSRGRTTYQ